MNILYAFDPSTVATGKAIFTDSRLYHVEVIEAKGLDDMLVQLSPMGLGEYAVVETPQSYPRDPVPCDDLIKIAVVSGACRAHFTTSEGVFPRVWSRGRPLKVNTERAKLLLSSEEIAKVEAVRKAVRGDAWSAVCIGLWKLGRLK